MASPNSASYGHQSLSQHDDEDHDGGEADHHYEKRTFLPLEIAAPDDTDENGDGVSSTNDFVIDEDDDDDESDDDTEHHRNGQHVAASSSLGGSLAASASLSPIMNLILDHQNSGNMEGRNTHFGMGGKYHHVATGSDDYDREDEMLDGVEVVTPPDLSWRELMALQGCNSVVCCVALLVLVLLGAVVLVPKGDGTDLGLEPPGEGGKSSGSSVFALTCRSNLFNETHSWPDFLTQMKENQKGISRCLVTNQECECTDRTNPEKPAYEDAEDLVPWQYAFNQNLKVIQNMKPRSKLDVVFVGDDKIERWSGNSWGTRKSDLEPYQKSFNKYFGGNQQPTTQQQQPQDEEESILSGLALGLSDDECPQVLYRLKHGILSNPTYKLEPNVWWIVVGSHDAIVRQCSYPNILAGLLEITNTILEDQPHSTVVLNSLLPMDLDQTTNYWSTIVAPINQAMECFAAGHYDDRVQFFNASDLFLDDSMLSASCTGCLKRQYFHTNSTSRLNIMGYEIWGKAIAERVRQIRKHKR